MPGFEPSGQSAGNAAGRIGILISRHRFYVGVSHERAFSS